MEAQISKILKPDLFSHFENEGFVQVKDLKKGDIIYECENGCNYELRVLQNPKSLRGGWACFVEDTKGIFYEMYVSKRLTKYGPRIYRCPQFLEEIANKGMFYIIK